MKRLALALLVFAPVATVMLLPPSPAVDADPGNSITSPDSVDWNGEYTSLALDASGNPVISYLVNGQYPATSGLKVLHCDDSNCAGNESGNIKLVDTGYQIGYCTFIPGYYTSLALDTPGNPVVSYRRPNCGTYVGALKLLHCTDANCAGKVITEPDPTADGGVTSSITLDGSGNPVVSHFDGDNAHLELRLVHCNDPNCTGGGKSLTTPDTVGYVGVDSSLALDASGNPVISYQYFSGGSTGYLKVLHCNDPNCSGDESANMRVVDEASDVDYYTSLELDNHGNPVVSYYSRSSRDLKVLHCNDPNCDPTVNGPESIASPDTDGDVGLWTSLALDAAGHPVVSYYDATNHKLKVLHCDTLACGAPFSPAVGGIAELPDVSGKTLEARDSSRPNAGALLGVAVSLAVAAVVLSGAVWYARRRWLRHRA